MAQPAPAQAPAQDLTTQITADALSKANGKDSTNLWVGVFVKEHGKVCIFDVKSAPQFYGIGSGYHIFTGRDSSRALATMNLKETESNISDLTPEQEKVLADWAKKYLEKYPIVGVLA